MQKDQNFWSSEANRYWAILAATATHSGSSRTHLADRITRVLIAGKHFLNQPLRLKMCRNELSNSFWAPRYTKTQISWKWCVLYAFVEKDQKIIDQKKSPCGMGPIGKNWSIRWNKKTQWLGPYLLFRHFSICIWYNFEMDPKPYNQK